MIIDRNVTPFVVFSEDPVLAALTKISANKQGVVFCVDERGVLQGSISDGDFRRWVSSTGSVDVTRPCLEIAFRKPTTGPLGAAPAELSGLFRPGVEIIPLVDERGHVAAVARQASTELTIGRHTVGAGHPALMIAEIGINHNGSVDLARRLVDLAAGAGADLVKFQLRDMDALYRNDSSKLGHGEDLGPQYTLDPVSYTHLTLPTSDLV